MPPGEVCFDISLLHGNPAFRPGRDRRPASEIWNPALYQMVAFLPHEGHVNHGEPMEPAVNSRTINKRPAYLKSNATNGRKVLALVLEQVCNII
jgi:hypothetical protein